jgi:hypothetical protein
MKANFLGTIGSLTGLQEQCNTFEQDNFVKLEKLEAVIDVDGEKATEGVFKAFDGDIGELGRAKITEAGSNSCFINEKKKNVSISRD